MSAIVAIAAWAVWAIWLTGRPSEPQWRWWADAALAMAGSVGLWALVMTAARTA